MTHLLLKINDGLAEQGVGEVRLYQNCRAGKIRYHPRPFTRFPWTGRSSSPPGSRHVVTGYQALAVA